MNLKPPMTPKKWLGDYSLQQQYPAIFSMSLSKDDVFKDVKAVDNNVVLWNLNLRRNKFDWEEEQFQNLMNVLNNQVLEEGEDMWRCKWDRKGLFSVKSLYKELRNDARDTNGLDHSSPPLKESTKGTRDKSKRCKVHDDYGTEDCHYLRRNIERLVQRGSLDKYLLNKTPKSTLAITTHNVINACFAKVSTLSSRQVKNAHRDKTHYLREYYHVNQLNFFEGLKVESYENEPLRFTE
ncbi:hypothetical protein FRX31_028530 [Thalictrum thalictroides]|uniref:Uncharacterized protein n=1 Tax=Thalictrum thalictroides TaxID=46969 RepID=A0A7J6V9W4_THATH|nr:hypothetical protein FRX31_028530 [Thalictrum thalictroides]